MGNNQKNYNNQLQYTEITEKTITIEIPVEVYSFEGIYWLNNKI